VVELLPIEHRDLEHVADELGFPRFLGRELALEESHEVRPALLRGVKLRQELHRFRVTRRLAQNAFVGAGCALVVRQAL
jgi:hypothetical protein